MNLTRILVLNIDCNPPGLWLMLRKNKPCEVTGERITASLFETEAEWKMACQQFVKEHGPQTAFIPCTQEGA